MRISQRIQSLSASPIRKLIPYSAAAEARGKKVYHLNIGQPDIATPPQFLEAVSHYSSNVLSYGDSHGEPCLISAIQRYYHRLGIEYAPSEITITNGGSEALMIALLSLCDPDDELLVLEPYYANYTSFAKIGNIRVNAVSCVTGSNFEFPGEETIEKHITPRTKAMLLTNPGNPTGHVYSFDEMNVIAGIVLRHNLTLIADEVYREFVYGVPYKSFGAMPELRDNLVLVDSVSKRFSACGARIGALLSHSDEFNRQILKYCQARLCCPKLDQIGAAALYDAPQEYLEKVNEEYRRRRDTIEEELAKIPGVVCSKPLGAFYVKIKMPVDDAEKFAIWLLEHFDCDGETVMFAPGSGFYATPGRGRNEARLAYVLECDKLKRAIKILGEGLKAYPGRTA